MNNNNFKTRKSALYVTLSENKDLKTAMMVLDKLEILVLMKLSV